MDLPDILVAALRYLPPEIAHNISLKGLSLGAGLGQAQAPDPCLSNRVFGLDFHSPIGLAAGYDKDAEAIAGAFKLGFGFVEVGTLTPKPQSGNPGPRLFRLSEDRAVINRMGFNNRGAQAAAHRLGKLRRQALPGPLGINIGKNKDTEEATLDYAACATMLAPYADYMVINVSSPNTPGLRALQSPDSLRELVSAVARSANAVGAFPPILIKIAPDLEQDDLESVARVACDPETSGLIVSNTTIKRPDGLKSKYHCEAGGLSGQPLMAASTEMVREMYRLTHGKVPLIGVGGIARPEEAYAKIRAGASLVQLYSALVYEGPGLIQRITRALPALLKKDGFETLADAIGADHK